MHPKIQVVHGYVRPDVSHLLLAGAPHFFHVVEVLLDRGSVGERFQDLDGRRARSVQKKACQPWSSLTSTTRIIPPTGA
jgi:hypothetical protein